jgi:hypothetical protein
MRERLSRATENVKINFRGTSSFLVATIVTARNKNERKRRIAKQEFNDTSVLTVHWKRKSLIAKEVLAIMTVFWKFIASFFVDENAELMAGLNDAAK